MRFRVAVIDLAAQRPLPDARPAVAPFPPPWQTTLGRQLVNGQDHIPRPGDQPVPALDRQEPALRFAGYTACPSRTPFSRSGAIGPSRGHLPGPLPAICGGKFSCTPSGSSTMTVRALEVQLTYAPFKRPLAPLITPRPIARAGPLSQVTQNRPARKRARSARSSYQQRVAVKPSAIQPLGRSAIIGKVCPDNGRFMSRNGGRCTYRIWCQLRAAVLGDRRMLQTTWRDFPPRRLSGECEPPILLRHGDCCSCPGSRAARSVLTGGV